MFKLKIIHKGLLILLLPFVIQTVLFGALFFLNQAAEAGADQARHRYRFIQRINVMLEDSGIAWATIINRLVTTHTVNKGSAISPAEYRTRTEIQLKELQAIPLVSENREEILTILDQIRNLQADTLDVLEDNRESFGTVESVPLLMMKMKQLHSRFYGARKRLDKVKTLLILEQNKLDDAIKHDDERRSWTKILLISGFVGQLVLMGGLLLWFLRDITSRLDKLVANARLLPTLTPLQERVSGSDELAYMDRVMHDASETLIESTQNRQSLMNMLAHDIRSPLMSSGILLDKLKEEAVSIPGVGTTANRLKNTFSQLTMLVEDLLTLDKYQDGEIELDLDLIDLRALVQEALETVKPQADKRGIQITNAVPEGEVVADRGRMLQVLNNLLANAVKYSPDNKLIEILGDFKAEKATVKIIDRGRGIAPTDLPHVFERFYQSAGSKQGFGLGLAICKMIVQSHGGRVGVESTVNQGSTFWFSLPIDA